MTTTTTQDLVYAFQPRKIDPPHFVAESADDLYHLLGSFVGGEQCDGCGNHSYVIMRDAASPIYWARCAADPDESDEYRHPAPCGHFYQLSVYDAQDVVF